MKFHPISTNERKLIQQLVKIKQVQMGDSKIYSMSTFSALRSLCGKLNILGEEVYDLDKIKHHFESGFDFNRTFSDGGNILCTLMIIAKSCKDTFKGESAFSCCCYLIKMGVNVNVTQRGRPFLFLAQSFLSPKFISLLHSKNMDFNVRDSRGRTVLFNLHSHEIIKLLIQNGADVNVLDDNGENALFSPARKINIPLVTFLLESGINPSVRNNFGKTVLDYIVYSKKLRNFNNVKDAVTLAKAICCRQGNHALLEAINLHIEESGIMDDFCAQLLKLVVEE